MTDVLVVGAGPVGLSLAIELIRHGVSCRIVDKAPAPSRYCRAIGVTPRTLEVWEDMGIAETMLEAGLWLTGIRMIVAGSPAKDVYSPDLGLPYAQLGLPQYETERLLTSDLARRGLEVERGLAVSDLEQDETGVDAEFVDAAGAQSRERFAYVVGCDGAHSLVRKAIGASFDGEAYPWPFMLGDVRMESDLPYGLTLRALRPKPDAPPDMFIAIPLPEPGRYRVSMLAPATTPAAGTEHGIQEEVPGPSLAELQAVANDLLPEKPRLSDLRWSSIFRISMRLASRYRQGRLFIAGDAAHIHPPTGGQGMNTGIQDAYNLAWKLALVARCAAPATLLDSYEAERRPVGADAIARTRAASERLGSGSQRGPEDLLVDAQVLISYRAGGIVTDDAGPSVPGPNAGDRAPDVRGLERQGFGFPQRLFDVLRGTGHVVIVAIDTSDVEALGGLSTLARSLSTDHHGAVRFVAIGQAEASQAAGLIVLRDPAGAFQAAYGPAGAFIIRPDGHIGWRGTDWQAEGLRRYLDTIMPEKGGPDRS